MTTENMTAVTIENTDHTTAQSTAPEYKKFLLYFLGLGFSAATATCFYLAFQKHQPLIGSNDCSNSFFLGSYEPCDTSVSCNDLTTAPQWATPATLQDLLNLCALNLCYVFHADEFWNKANGDSSFKTSCKDSGSAYSMIYFLGAIILSLPTLAFVFSAASAMKKHCTRSSEGSSLTAAQQRFLPAVADAPHDSNSAYAPSDRKSSVSSATDTDDRETDCLPSNRTSVLST